MIRHALQRDMVCAAPINSKGLSPILHQRPSFCHQMQVQSTFGQPYDGGLVGSSNGVGVDHGYILLYQRNSPASEAPLPMDELP